MDSGFKFVLYDWAGANAALLTSLQPETAALSVLAWLVSAIGSYWGAPVVLTALAWWAGRARDTRRAQHVDCQMRRFVVSGLLALAITWVLKLALDLPRPFEVMAVAERIVGIWPSTGSLPSGHSVYAAVLAAALWPLVSSATRGALLVLVLVIGWSRVALGVHFPADVMIGWMVGLTCTALASRIVLPAGVPQPHRARMGARERLRLATTRCRAGDLDAAFRLLEEAHVLGQRDLLMHARVHLRMLQLGAMRGDVHEVLGQIGRLAVVPIGHLTGRLPAGNTGGANVPAFRPMPSKLHDIATAADAAPQDVQSQTVQQPSGHAWWTLGLTIAGIDLTVKAAVHSGLDYGTSIPVTAFFNIVHRWNTGAAFSFLADAGGWQRYFFIVLALAVSAFLLWLLRRPLQRADALGYSLIVGGALGNAIDRILRGYVVDYLDLHWGGYHWPAFNVADVAISLAVVALIAGSVKAHSVSASRPMQE